MDIVVVPHPPGIRRIERKLEALNGRMVAAVARDARRGCPVDDGELLDSITDDNDGLVGEVRVGTDHWWPTEYGADAHLILPRTKKALWWPGAKHPVASVMHPGNDPQPFMRPALYTRRGPRGGAQGRVPF